MEKKVEQLMQNANIIRKHFKINAYFDVVGTPIQNAWMTIAEFSITTPLVKKISMDLKSMGFKFIGPTSLYAYMQSVCLVNDHLTSCFCYESKRNYQYHNFLIQV